MIGSINAITLFLTNRQVVPRGLGNIPACIDICAPTHDADKPFHLLVHGSELDHHQTVVCLI